jgi:hypothetical protein
VLSNKTENEMTDTSSAAIPADDASRKLALANPDDPAMRHISVAGGTYTILISGNAAATV